jgi:hypothetical protein
MEDDYSSDAIVRLNEDCQETEIIMMSTPWWNPQGYQTSTDTLLDNMTMLAYACHSDYSMATIPVRVVAVLEVLSLEFDEDLFHQMRKPMPSTILDMYELQNIYTDTTWSQFIPQRSTIDPTMVYNIFGGAAAILGYCPTNDGRTQSSCGRCSISPSLLR